MKMYELTGIYSLYHSWTHDLHDYRTTPDATLHLSKPTSIRLQRWLHTTKKTHEPFLYTTTLRPDFEKDLHFPSSPKMPTFTLKACPLQNKNPKSTQKHLNFALRLPLLHTSLAA